MSDSSKLDLEQQEHFFENAYKEAAQLKEDLNQTEKLELNEGLQRYEIQDMIGEGATKKVYKAYDKVIQRKVALAKVKSDDPERIKDMLYEVRLASKLEHPNIAPIYDVGQDEDDLIYFVMKIYDGRPLDEELKHRSTNSINLQDKINWSLNIFIKVCEALAFAHSKGVLHLDIKPANIRIDDFGEVLLCDWGISNMIRSYESEHPEIEPQLSHSVVSRATLIGEIRGTPGYMAPEQKSKEYSCNEATDIFGLGALLHEMLCGSPLKEKSSPQLPHELKSICHKAMSISKEDRYQSVHDFIQDLENYRSDQVTLAENANWSRTIIKWIKRNRKPLLVLGLNLIFISVGLLIYIFNIQKANQKLANTNYALTYEKKKQAEERAEQATSYFKQGNRAYQNTVSKFDFDSGDLALAKEMMVRSTQLDPTNREAWGMLGNIRAVNGEYEIAVSDYQKAGEKYQLHLDALQKHLPTLLLKRENYLDDKLKLIRDLSFVKDPRLRNHMIFKEIHTFHELPDLLSFSIGAVAIVNNMETIDYQYNPEKFALHLSEQPVRTVYPLKTLPLKKLYLRHTRMNGHELYNLRRLPLTHLDAAYSKIGHLDRFMNFGIQSLDLSGNPLKTIKNIEHTNVTYINIAHTKITDFSPLKACQYLRRVTCSEEQIDVLKRLLGEEVQLELDTTPAHSSQE